jgi:hypothetical protein
MIFYTNKLIPDGFDSITLGTVILIRPSKRGDKDLIAHEQFHVQQFKSSKHSAIGFWFKYLTNADFRIQCEAEAYKVSIANGLPLIEAAILLMGYGKKMTLERAKELLR